MQDVWTDGIAAVMNVSNDEAAKLRVLIEDQFAFEWRNVTGSQVKAMCLKALVNA